MRNISRSLCVAAMFISGAGSMQAQAPAPPGPAPGPTPTVPGPTPTPTPPPTIPGRGPTAPTTPSTVAPRPPRPIFVSGRVILHDGGELPERATIERLCSTNSVRAEGYTDSKGYFSFQVGQGQMALPDASTAFAFDANNPNGLPSSPTENAAGMQTGNPDNPYWDCELRARLPGYRSTSILLAGRKPMDSPDIGQLVLYPLGEIEGRAVSVTTALAPKNAKKAYEDGLKAVKKDKKEDAEKNFRKAVELYPRYAEAWTELGKVLLERQKFVEARAALNQAVAADSRYVFPHEQLYFLAFEEGNWEELAEATQRLLRLNPYDFIAAYYYNGVAHYRLGHFDQAEKSLREAMGMDFRNQIVKTRYVLGLVLVEQKNYTEAVDLLRAFAKQAPNDPMIPKVNSILTQIEALPRAQAAPPVK